MLGTAPPRHPKYRTKLCRNFVTGGCPFGQKCSFLHPAPRVDPSFSSVAHLWNWNALFQPQLLALSNQQGKNMSGWSPPLLQRPQLVDEDPSPPTSLLLSESDCTPSEQVPQTRRSSRRKRYPCRHFVRTGGWCPAAGQCRFYHDVSALPSAGVRKAERVPPSAGVVSGEGRKAISGGVLMGIQSRSPPIVNHAHSERLYNGPDLMQPYHPMYLPNYNWQPYQPYYAAVPICDAVAPSSGAQQSVYPPLQAQTVPSNEAQTSLPLWSYEVNGTTYFPTSMASAPPPVTYPVPIQPHNHAMAPVYSYYAPPTLPSTYYDIPNQPTDVGSQTSFDPFGSDPMVPSELPVIPRLEDYQMSPIQQDVLHLSSPFAPSGDLGLMTPTDKPTVTQEHEFPYRPPKSQQVGHARRISVNIKKHGRVNSG